MGSRYENDPAARFESGFADSTYKTILERIEQEGQEGKRLFIKDISYYLVPPCGQEAEIAPSLLTKRRGIGTVNGNVRYNGSLKPPPAPFPYGTEAEPGNPTPIPEEVWKRFHLTFLIRDPHNSISSFYRCTVPPLDDVTGWYNFDPSEMGYLEQRRLFDYLVASGQVGPKLAGSATNGVNGASTKKDSSAEICVIDADDLLDNPESVVKAFCKSVNLEFQPDMLQWNNDELHENAKVAFEKWKGWHEDAIESKDLKPRPPHKKKQKTEEQWDAEWKTKFGEEAAKVIRKSVDANMADYLYLKQFAIRVSPALKA